MSFLAVAVSGAGALGLVNFWLTVALARRLREHSEQLAGQAPQRTPPRPVGPEPGTAVPEFSVMTVSGAVVSAADLRGERSLIGFFTPGCQPCHAQVRSFVTLARSLRGGPGHALAVVSNGGRAAAGVPAGDAGSLVEDLAEAAHVITGSSASEVAAALAVTGYPSFILISADGRVEAGAHAIAGLDTVPAPASSA
jgi:thiol-disulfide isomerase/thioredoxin